MIAQKSSDSTRVRRRVVIILTIFSVASRRNISIRRVPYCFRCSTSCAIVSMFLSFENILVYCLGWLVVPVKRDGERFDYSTLSASCTSLTSSSTCLRVSLMSCLSQKSFTAPVIFERVSAPFSGATRRPTNAPATAPPMNAPM